MTTPSLTTAPPEVIQFFKAQAPFLDHLAHQVCPTTDPASTQRNVRDSSDEIRKLFPHLDDTTLAAVLAYAAVGCAQAGQLVGCADLISMGATYAEVALAMAWQLATPDGIEPA